MRWLPWVLAGVFALVAFVLSQRTPEVIYRDVVVTEETIVEVERVDTVVTFVEKIRWREREPETVATAELGAVGLVRSFCAPSLAGDTAAGGDSISPVRPTLLLRSVVHDPGWFWKPDRLTLTGPMSNNDLRQLRYEVRDGYRAHVRGDGVLMQTPRGWWVRPLLEATAYIGAGYVAGRLTP